MRKVCFKCGRRKLVTSFYVHPQMADGRLGKCKDCTKKDVRAVPPEKRQAYEKRRASSPERRAKQVEYTRLHRLRNPGRHAARQAVANALRRGQIIKTSCHRCGSNERVQAHHHDYRKKLDVEWLCFPCHRTGHP